jgi:PAS domain S-box-containing protein
MAKSSECGSLPHLHSLIVEQMSDAVIALDRHGCIALWNRAAERLFHLSACTVLGRRPHEVPLTPWFSPADEAAAVSAERRGEAVRREGVLSNGNGRSIHLEYAITALSSTDGTSAGMVVILRDISAAKRCAHDREQQLEALQRASDRFRLFQGLVPICSHCKQIRDPGGSWHEMDAYLHEQCGVKLTHGICPACLTRLHAEYDDRPPTSP